MNVWRGGVADPRMIDIQTPEDIKISVRDMVVYGLCPTKDCNHSFKHSHIVTRGCFKNFKLSYDMNFARNQQPWGNEATHRGRRKRNHTAFSFQSSIRAHHSPLFGLIAVVCRVGSWMSKSCHAVPHQAFLKVGPTAQQSQVPAPPLLLSPFPQRSRRAV